MNTQATVAIGFLLTLAAAPAARAQAPDSALFHRGQWGTEFSITSSFGALGLLHFKSPAKALFVDVGGSLGHSSSDNGTGTSTLTSGDLAFRVGPRSYHGIGGRVYRIMTFGVSALYSWSTSQQDTLFHNSSHQLGGGLFAEVGATWLVTPHLGLGADFGAAASYRHITGPSANGDIFSFEFGTIRLAGQLYF